MSSAFSPSPTSLAVTQDRQFRWLHISLILTGVLAIAASLLLEPAPSGQAVRILGHELESSCMMQAVLHVPCWSCGMTRSFVHAVRGRLGEAWTFNPAGALLFVALVLEIPYRSARLGWPGRLPRLGWLELGFGVAWLFFLFGSWIWRAGRLLFE